MDNNVYTAEQFFKDWNRMCESFDTCPGCEIEKYDDICALKDESERLINEVREWALEHPLKTFKIRHEELYVGYFDVEARDRNEAIEKFREKYKEEGVDLSQMEVVRSNDYSVCTGEK